MVSFNPLNSLRRHCERSEAIQYGVSFIAALGCFAALAMTSCIRVYRYAFSLLFGHCCRFEPSCSAYAIEAINVHGCLKGCYYALSRVLRCHPWHAGGVDPVPLNHLNQRKRC